MIPDQSATIAKIRQRQASGESCVLAGGVYDLLGIHHIRSLHQAATFGDFLVVALNSNSSVVSLKGSSRPIHSQEIRQETLEALRFVDHVVLFDEITTDQVIRLVKPDVFFKSSSAPPLPCEAEAVRHIGAVVVLGDVFPGLSTTELIRRIQSQEPQNSR